MAKIASSITARALRGSGLRAGSIAFSRLQPRLQQHYQHVRYVEEHARWAESYERVRVRRDGFVEELRDRFPKVLAELGVRGDGRRSGEWPSWLTPSNRKIANALSDEAAASHVLSELLLEVGAAIGEAERVGEEERGVSATEASRIGCRVMMAMPVLRRWRDRRCGGGSPVAKCCGGETQPSRRGRERRRRRRPVRGRRHYSVDGGDGYCHARAGG